MSKSKFCKIQVTKSNEHEHKEDDENVPERDEDAEVLQALQELADPVSG